MPNKTLIQAIASTLQARENCRRSGNADVFNIALGEVHS